MEPHRTQNRAGLAAPEPRDVISNKIFECPFPSSRDARGAGDEQNGSRRQLDQQADYECPDELPETAS